MYQKISQMVESYDGIVGTHDLIVHNYGPNQGMATIHAEVPNDVNIEVSHAIIDRIAHDSYQINITSIDVEHDRSMREVYGLDKTLRE